MSTNGVTEDSYIHHPRGLTLRFRVIPGEFMRAPQLSHEPDLGGLRFESRRPVRPGALLEVTVVVRGDSRTFRGAVHWVERLRRHFEIALGFASPEDAFCARMTEQVCHIEAYRRQCSRREGRAISAERAARAWIERYAETFPPLYREQPAQET